jgi:hypothetical protein
MVFCFNTLSGFELFCLWHLVTTDQSFGTHILSVTGATRLLGATEQERHRENQQRCLDEWVFHGIHWLFK